MTQEEKTLLLKDLCARLPYGVKCSCTWSHEVPNGTTGCIQELSTFLIVEIEIMDNPEYDCQICDVKPYLRPMSSMTEEEHGQYMDFMLWSYNDYDATTTNCVDKERINEYKEFIYSHHLDDGDLIGKGLANNAPEGMYKIK